MASTSGKLLPLLALLVTTGVSVVLFVFRHHLFGGNFHTFVEDSRTAVQVLVQVLSFFLAMLQIYVLRTLFAYATRLILPGRKLTLDKLSLFAAISQGKIDFSLSTQNLLIISTLVALTALPSALWAGALTPIVSTQLQVNGTVAVPRFSTASSSVWDSQFQIRMDGEDIQVWNILDNCTTIHDQRGFIPSCPVPSLQGLLLLSATSATPTDPNQPRLHSKLDNNRWSYSGRSFGVGSSAGIAQPVFDEAPNAFVTYKFQEAGYNTQVECGKNASSALTITFEISDTDGFSRYNLNGQLANEPAGTVEFFPITSWHSDYSNLLAWAARSYQRSNVITLASGTSGYTAYNQTQCEVSFIPTTFEVSVNLTSKLITVEELPGETQDFEPTGQLIVNAIQSINLLSRMSNTLYVSVMGDSLAQNVFNTQQRDDTTSLDDNIINSAVSDSFTAMIDDILAAYGASQLLNAKDTTPVTVTGLRKAVSIGRPTWIYVVVGFNSFVLLAYIVELLRTRFWRGLAQFDYTNMKCTIAAVSAGGSGIAEQISDWTLRRENKYWDGNPGDSAFHHVRVILNQHGQGN